MDKELILSRFKDYTRSDLFFEKDVRFGGQGWVYEDDPWFDYHIGGYTWRIEDSNANIDNYGFSFYLAYFALKGHTLDVPEKQNGVWYDFSMQSVYKRTGYLDGNPDFGMVEVSLVGDNDDFDGGLIIGSAKEVNNKEVALYIKQRNELFGRKAWGFRAD